MGLAISVLTPGFLTSKNLITRESNSSSDIVCAPNNEGTIKDMIANAEITLIALMISILPIAGCRLNSYFHL